MNTIDLTPCIAAVSASTGWRPCSTERKFTLAEHVEVRGAELENGLLTIRPVKEIPEAMKPRRIEIDPGSDTLEHDRGSAEKISHSATA